ncbi:hypothetical protein DQ04_05381000, partial [Trypanosoma grayi]|uniref:hypothetical protein n=1 Tax=Trypanosoma grayi TaxID=71804 RepID=UPI0004F4BD7E
MGGKLSTQEGLFVLSQWPELLENAMSADAEAAAGGGSNKHTSSSAFRMSFQEWQALITLLDNTGPSDVPSRLCAGFSDAQIRNPIVVVMVHACCWFDGSISSEVLTGRLASVGDAVRSRRENQQRLTKEEEAEDELVDIALRVFTDAVRQKAAASHSSRRGTEKAATPGSTAMDALIAWDGSRRPVVTLAHAYIVGAVACAHAEPRYAEAAIQLLRKLQEAMGDAAASVSRGRQAERGSACSINEWRLTQRLEAA